MGGTPARSRNSRDWLAQADLLAQDAKATMVTAHNATDEDTAKLRAKEAQMLATLASAATTAALAMATLEASS